VLAIRRNKSIKGIFRDIGIFGTVCIRNLQNGKVDFDFFELDAMVMGESNNLRAKKTWMWRRAGMDER
jgi:hypothetical protein